MEDNKSLKLIVGIIAVVAVIGGFIIFNNNDSKETKKDNTSQSQTTKQDDKKKSETIVDKAIATPDLSTLVTAVKAGGLVETLSGKGPFTVFAPTNAAFNALPEGTLNSLLEPANVEQLKSILTYHVVSGKVMSSDLSDGQEITTVQGNKLTVKITDGMVYLVDAKGSQIKVETADVNASNGVVHIVSGVLLPE